MEIGSASWQRLITEGAAGLGVTVSAHQAAAMADHARALLTWNRRTNLTRIVEAEAVAVRHFVDSLAILPQLNGCRSVLDIGTGGGFPGVVGAIMMPGCRVVLLDAVRKKISFLQVLIRTLALEKVIAVHTRAESLHTDAGYRQRFDAVVSRACGDLSATLAAAAPFAGRNARIIAMRGPRGADECREFEASEDHRVIAGIMGHPLHIETIAFDLPRGHGRRYLLVFR